METTIVYRDYIGIMEKKMETTIVYWGYIGIMEKKMESTTVYWGYIGIMDELDMFPNFGKLSPPPFLKPASCFKYLSHVPLPVKP